MKFGDKALERLHADVMGYPGPAKRYRKVPVLLRGEPESTGLEFVVGPWDPPVTVAEIVLAAVDPVFVTVPTDKIQITGNVMEDGYVIISLSRIPKSGRHTVMVSKV